MTKSNAQIFHEMTDGCWHEVVPYQDDDRLENYQCKKCSHTFLVIHPLMDNVNPSYSNAADILNRMKEFCGEKKFKKFIKKISTRKHIDYAPYDEEPDKISFVPMSLTDFIEKYILNPSLLLEEAIEFLKEEK